MFEWRSSQNFTLDLALETLTEPGSNVKCLALLLPWLPKKRPWYFIFKMVPLLQLFFHVFNPEKTIQLFGLEISVCHYCLSSESAVGNFDWHIHPLQNTPFPPRKKPNPNSPQTLTKSEHLQCEDFVPFRIEVLVDGMCQQSVIV